MAYRLGAAVGIEAGEISALRQSAACNPDHGRGVVGGLGWARPMAIETRRAIFSRRNSAACLVRAGNFGVGCPAAMAGASGTRVRTGARTGDGRGARAAALHERGRGLSRSRVVP